MAKRCPTCNRSFDDASLSFCLEDGTPLVNDSSRANSQETLVSPSAAPTLMGAAPPTQNFGQLPGKATVNVSNFDVPVSARYAPPAPARSKTPWVIAIVAVVLIAIGGIVAAAVFIPPLLKESSGNNNSKGQPTPSRSDWTATPTPKPSAEAADDVPTDEDEVLTQLTRVEEDWTRANIKGDQKALERILAEEYSAGADAPSKRAYIDSLKPDPEVKTWELKDITVAQNHDRATVTGTLTQETTKGTESYDFTDKFVWRDSRWQAVSSKNGPLK